MISIINFEPFGLLPESTNCYDHLIDAWLDRDFYKLSVERPPVFLINPKPMPAIRAGGSGKWKLNQAARRLGVAPKVLKSVLERWGMIRRTEKNCFATARGKAKGFTSETKKTHYGYEQIVWVDKCALEFSWLILTIEKLN